MKIGPVTGARCLAPSAICWQAMTGNLLIQSRPAQSSAARPVCVTADASRSILDKAQLQQGLKVFVLERRQFEPFGENVAQRPAQRDGFFQLEIGKRVCRPCSENELIWNGFREPAVFDADGEQRRLEGL